MQSDGPLDRLARMVDKGVKAKPPSQTVKEQRHYRYQSGSQFLAAYEVVKRERGWACQCEGYQFTNLCYHLGHLVDRAEREGWDIERIAGLRVKITAGAWVDEETGEVRERWRYQALPI